MGTASLVLGIVALVLAFIPCINIFSCILGTVGFILGLIAFIKAKKAGGQDTKALVGFILCIIADVMVTVMDLIFSCMGSY